MVNGECGNGNYIYAKGQDPARRGLLPLLPGFYAAEITGTVAKTGMNAILLKYTADLLAAEHQ